MRFRAIVLALVALFAASSLASAQQQTGQIFGKVTDGSGAILPGVTVTLSGPVLLQPLTAITSETGTYEFPRLSIGTYTVKFDLIRRHPAGCHRDVVGAGSAPAAHRDHERNWHLRVPAPEHRHLHRQVRPDR